MASDQTRPTDRLGADIVLAYLEEQGLSPQAFSREAFNSGHGFVSSRTIYRIVEKGVRPSIRVRAVIARQMARTPASIWRNAPVVAGRKITTRSRVAA